MATSRIKNLSDDTVESAIDGLHVSAEDSNPKAELNKPPFHRPGMTYDEEGNELVTLEQLQAGVSAVKTSIDETDEDITPGELEARFEREMDIWRESSCREELLQVIEAHQPDGGNFDKVVCLASGRFCQQESDDWACRNTTLTGSGRKSLIQLACVVDVAGEMAKRQGNKVELLAQEPQYTPRDLALLASQEVKVIEMDLTRGGLNVAKDHVGPRTVLFDFFACKDPLMLKDLYSGDIGVLIGSPLEAWYDEENSDDEQDFHPVWGARLPPVFRREFKSTHDSYKFPRFDDLEYGNPFGNRMVYWRKK